MNLIVNGQEIPAAIFQQAMTHLKTQHPHLNQNELAKKATEDVIRHALLHQAAAKEIPPVAEELVQQEFIRYKMNFKNEAEFLRMCESNQTSESGVRENIRNSMRVDIFVDRIAGNPLPPTEEEIRRVFESEPSASEKPVMVTAAQIVKRIDPQNYVDVYLQLCKTREELLDGADFAAMADRMSEGKDGKGGVFGPVAPGQLAEELNAILFSLRRGEISPVFQTRFGLHIVKVTDRDEAKKLTLEECRERIRDGLIHRAREANIEKWFTAARNKATVSVKK